MDKHFSANNVWRSFSRPAISYPDLSPQPSLDVLTASVSLPRGPRDPGDIDSLSGLATRQRLMRVMGEMLRKGKGHVASSNGPPSLILLDLDRFNAVNDSLGPLVGDELLCRVAQRLRSLAPRSPLIARISGNGFAVVVSGEEDSELKLIAARLLEFLSRAYVVSGHAVTVGTSLGVATAGVAGETALELLHAAGLAMHAAQQEGRNRVLYFHPSMREKARERHALESDFRGAMAMEQMELQRALLGHQFEVHYQPQLTLEGGRLTGFEALVRWRHPRRGLVSPAEFIPMAEDIGLIDLLGEWVLRTACKDAQSWPTPVGCAPLRIAVNVSPLQLRDGVQLMDGIRRALSESRLAVERLEIELTETALTLDIGDTLIAIRRLGVSLALDDFGIGYSSLGRLRDHPFSRIKIDRSFISGLGRPGVNGEKQPSEWMMRAIASLGVGLGLATVAEGIETQEQLEAARDAGCIEMQGYLVSRPVPATEVPWLIQLLSDAAERR